MSAAGQAQFPYATPLGLGRGGAATQGSASLALGFGVKPRWGLLLLRRFAIISANPEFGWAAPTPMAEIVSACAWNHLRAESSWRRHRREQALAAGGKAASAPIGPRMAPTGSA